MYIAPHAITWYAQNAHKRIQTLVSPVCQRIRRPWQQHHHHCQYNEIGIAFKRNSCTRLQHFRIISAPICEMQAHKNEHIFPKLSSTYTHTHAHMHKRTHAQRLTTMLVERITLFRVHIKWNRTLHPGK